MKKLFINLNMKWNMQKKILPGGEIVKVKTNDCWFQQITTEDQVVKEINYEILNPATGPLYIEGAEPGDLLKVKILCIDVESKGSAVAVPNEGVLGDKVENPPQ